MDVLLAMVLPSPESKCHNCKGSTPNASYVGTLKAESRMPNMESLGTGRGSMSKRFFFQGNHGAFVEAGNGAVSVQPWPHFKSQSLYHAGTRLVAVPFAIWVWVRTRYPTWNPVKVKQQLNLRSPGL